VEHRIVCGERATSLRADSDSPVEFSLPGQRSNGTRLRLKELAAVRGCLRKRKFVITTDSSHGLTIYPNLARGSSAQRDRSALGGRHHLRSAGAGICLLGQIVLSQNPIHPLRIHAPTPPPELLGDARSPVTGKLRRDPLNRIPQFHVLINTRSKDRQRLESRWRPSVGMSFRLAIPWPVALQQSRPPLRQLRASVNQSLWESRNFQSTVHCLLTVFLTPGGRSSEICSSLPVWTKLIVSARFSESESTS